MISKIATSVNSLFLIFNLKLNEKSTRKNVLLNLVKSKKYSKAIMFSSLF